MCAVGLARPDLVPAGGSVCSLCAAGSYNDTAGVCVWLMGMVGVTALLCVEWDTAALDPCKHGATLNYRV